MQCKSNILNMREAGNYLGQSYRWMQRHWVDLAREGVLVYRVPRDSEKGRLMFDRGSLERYMKCCEVCIKS